MPEAADIETKVAAWRLATQDNIPYREVARRLGISDSSVSNYVKEGRFAETLGIALAKRDKQQDVGHWLRVNIAHWMARMRATDDVKLELAISEHLLKLMSRFILLFGLDEPTRVAVGLDDDQPKTPDPRMVAAIREAQRDNREYLARLEAGLPGWPNDEEESA